MPYDRRKRCGITRDGEKKAYCLRRLRCKACRKMHLELPNNLIPKKRYEASVIEAMVTQEDLEGYPEDERTRSKIRSWYRWFKVHLHAVWQKNILEGFASPIQPLDFKTMVRAIVNTGHWPYHPNGHYVRP